LLPVRAISTRESPREHRNAVISRIASKREVIPR
jgi:hypothetical protein